MSPVRLVILIILFYFAYRLIRSMLISRKEKEEILPGRQAAEQEINDVLEEDPVCGALVPRHQAVRLRSGDQVLYFCSDACCDAYLKQKKGEQ